jgi:hypothetical protein
MSNLNLKVETNRTSWSTNYYVTGAEVDVNMWCAQLVMNYHPAGYGTYCRLHKQHPDGTVTFLAHRANSCD